MYREVARIRCINCGREERIHLDTSDMWRCYCGCTSWEFSEGELARLKKDYQVIKGVDVL